MRDDAPVHPLRLAHEINEFLTENTIYIGDGGDVVTFSGGVVQPKGPGLWMDPGPLGHPRRRRAVRDGRQAAGRTARSSACSATAPSASPAGTSRRWSASTCRSSASSATTRT